MKTWGKLQLAPGLQARPKPAEAGLQAKARPTLVIGVFGLFTCICGTGMAQTDPAFFATKLYPILEAAQCRGCHAEDGVASATRLHFPESDAGRDRVQAFGLSLVSL